METDYLRTFLLVVESGSMSEAARRLEQMQRAGAARVRQARLPAGYVAEARLRIDFYRRLALAETPFGGIKDSGVGSEGGSDQPPIT